MSNSQAKELLVQHGLWSDELPTEAPVLATKPEADEVSKRLILAYEKVMAADAGNKVLLAKICAHLRSSSGLKVQEIGEWLVAACPQWEKSFGWVCRLVRAGDLLLKWPQLSDVSIDRLCALQRIEKKLQAEVFASGLLPSGEAFRSLDRETLLAAVNALRGQRPPKAEVIPTVKARQEIERFTAVMTELTAELAQLQRFPQIQEQLQQWQQQLLKMLEEALAVTAAPRGPIIQHNGRAQFYIR
jgi:hypothetical protein